MKRIGLNDLLGLGDRLLNAAEQTLENPAIDESEEKTLREKLSQLAAHEPGALTRAVLDFTPFDGVDGGTVPAFFVTAEEDLPAEKPDDTTEEPPTISAPVREEAQPAPVYPQTPDAEKEAAQAELWQPPREVLLEAAHINYGRRTEEQGRYPVREAEQSRDLLRQMERLLWEEMAFCGEEVYRT